MNLIEVFKDVKQVWYFGDEYTLYHVGYNKITLSRHTAQGWASHIEVPGDRIEELMKQGKLKILDEKDKPCFHIWIKYTGFREVYHYCEKCNEKQAIDWRTLK